MRYLSSYAPKGSFPRRARNPDPAPVRELPEPPKAVLSLENARRWVKAELSLKILGPVSGDVMEARAVACLTCVEGLSQRKDRPDAIGWCSKCGCGGGDKARLSRKVMMPAAECPLGRW